MVGDIVSPFGYRRGEGVDAGFGEHDWICERDRTRTDGLFEALNPIDGKISGAGNCPLILLNSMRTSHYLTICDRMRSKMQPSKADE